MLVTLRLFLASGEQRLLATDVDERPEAPEELLARFDRSGRIALGDRESVSRDDVVGVEFAPAPEPDAAPAWGPGLRDEDVASALKEDFDAPPGTAR